MSPKYATQDQFENVKQDVTECKGMIFDIKDNHLKHLQGTVDKMKGRQDIILIMISAMLGSGVVGGIVALIMRFT